MWKKSFSSAYSHIHTSSAVFANFFLFFFCSFFQGSKYCGELRKLRRKNAVKLRMKIPRIYRECAGSYSREYRGGITSINRDPIRNAGATLTGDDEFAFGMIYRSSGYIGTWYTREERLHVCVEVRYEFVYARRVVRQTVVVVFARQ